MFGKKKSVPFAVKTAQVYVHRNDPNVTAVITEFIDNVIIYDTYQKGVLQCLAQMRSTWDFEQHYDPADKMCNDFYFIEGPDPQIGYLYPNRDKDVGFAHVKWIVGDLVIYDVWNYKGELDCRRMRSKKDFKSFYIMKEIICKSFGNLIENDKLKE